MYRRDPLKYVLIIPFPPAIVSSSLVSARLALVKQHYAPHWPNFVDWGVILAFASMTGSNKCHSLLNLLLPATWTNRGGRRIPARLRDAAVCSQRVLAALLMVS
ncbi:MAG: hypothetical protein ABIQ36_08105 [Rhodanobacter sp.]